MTDVAAFLTARIDDEERRARQLKKQQDAGMRLRFDWLGQPLADRVLAECAAKRRILELNGRRSFAGLQTVEDVETQRAIGPVLRALASVWRDHPDYDPSWGAR